MIRDGFFSTDNPEAIHSRVHPAWACVRGKDPGGEPRAMSPPVRDGLVVPDTFSQPLTFLPWTGFFGGVRPSGTVALQDDCLNRSGKYREMNYHIIAGPAPATFLPGYPRGYYAVPCLYHCISTFRLRSPVSFRAGINFSDKCTHINICMCIIYIVYDNGWAVCVGTSRLSPRIVDPQSSHWQ